MTTERQSIRWRCEPGTDLAQNPNIRECGEAQELLAEQIAVHLFEPNEQLQAADE